MTEDTPSEHNDEHEYVLAPGIGLPLLEQLLLALIDAHPSVGPSATRREERLNQAVLAVTGQKRSSGPLPGDPETKALLFMAHEHHKDRAARSWYEFSKRVGKEVSPKPPKVRSVLALAKLAANQFFPSSDLNYVKAHTDRLREKFSGSYQKKLRVSANAKFPEKYMHQAIENDHVTETFERQSLDKILNELKRWRVASSTDKL